MIFVFLFTTYPLGSFWAGADVALQTACAMGVTISRAEKVTPGPRFDPRGWKRLDRSVQSVLELEFLSRDGSV